MVRPRSKRVNRMFIHPGLAFEKQPPTAAWLSHWIWTQLAAMDLAHKSRIGVTRHEFSNNCRDHDEPCALGARLSDHLDADSGGEHLVDFKEDPEFTLNSKGLSSLLPYVTMKAAVQPVVSVKAVNKNPNPKKQIHTKPRPRHLLWPG